MNAITLIKQINIISDRSYLVVITTLVIYKLNNQHLRMYIILIINNNNILN